MTARSNNDTGRGPARLVTVDAESADRRLDNFLLTELKGVPRTRIYRMIRKGEVRVNKGRAKPSTRLVEGDKVRVPPVAEVRKGAAPPVAPGRASWILDHVIHEDDHLLVIDKPAGLAVHGGSGVSLGAIELLRAALPDYHYLELAHRLDRDTSGCLLLAKKRSALRRVHEEFRNGNVEKIYFALLLGDWGDAEREVDLPLRVDNREGGERHVRPSADGKPAFTRFIPYTHLDGTVLARVELLTGRTHQIRAHAAAIGHPVAGDARYGEGLPGPGRLDRLFLHAHKLGICHPKDGRMLKFEAPLDAQLKRVLDNLQQG